MPDLQYGPPSWLPTNWDEIQKAKASGLLAPILAASFGDLVDHRPGDQHTSKALQRLETDSRLGGNLSDRKRYQLLKRISDAEFRTIAADAGTRQDALRSIRPSGYGLRPFGGGGLLGLGLLFTPTDAGDSRSDFGYADRLDKAQKKGLEGRRLYPFKRGSPPVSGRAFRYGEEPKFKGRAPKRESAFQREQRKRKEEEQDAFQRMLMQYNQGMQNSVSRPSIVPPVIWDAYVPDEGMSNYAVFDDIGRFEGIDMDAMLESMGVGPPPGYSKRKV